MDDDWQASAQLQTAEHHRTGGEPSSLKRRAPWLVFAIALLGEAAVLIVQDRKLWFDHDDFSFLLGRQLSPHPVAALMEPHNVHWSTLPFIAFRVMWHVFGLRHYLPYALMPLVLHLGLAVSLTVLIRRAGAGTWPAVLSGVVFAYLGGGAGAQNPLWAFQIGFIGSCLAGVLAVHCLDVALERNSDRSSRRWFWGAQVLLVASLMCSGIGLPMVGVATIWTVLRRGWTAALRVVALPALIFLGWYAGWGHDGPSTQPIGSALVHAPVQAARAIGSVWSAATDVTDTGPLILIALVVAVVLTRNEPPLRVLAVAGLAGFVLEYLVIAVGRADLDTTLRSRYVYVGLALCTPAVACLFTLAARHTTVPRWVDASAWVAIALVVVVLGANETADFAAGRQAADPARKQELLAAAALMRSGAPLLSDRIDPVDRYPDPAMSVSKIRAAHALSDVPSGRPSPTTLFDERSTLQVDLRRSKLPVPPAHAYHWADRWTPTPSTGRGQLHTCTTRSEPGGARLAIALGTRGGQVRIAFAPKRRDGAVVHTRILQGHRVSISTPWPLTARFGLAGGRLFAASTMHNAMLQVAFPAGRIAVCPVR